MEDIVIKVALNESDREQCRSLINEAFLIRQLVSRRDKEMIQKENSEKELAGINKKLFMLFNIDSNILIGTVVLVINGLNSAIQYLSVSPVYFGQGFGKVLLLHAENVAREQGCINVFLSVISHPLQTQDKLANWYKVQGYKFNNRQEITEINKIEWFSSQYLFDISAHFYKKELKIK